MRKNQIDKNLEKTMVELIRYGQMISSHNLVVRPGGNISFKYNNICYITPSELGFNKIGPEDFVGVDITRKKIVSGKRKPSSEISIHIDIYQARPDISIIFYTHPPVTIGIIGAGARIRALFPDFIVYLGQEIPVIGYTTPCTQRLSDMISGKLEENNAVAMIKHGLTVVGKNFKEAQVRPVLVEESAKMIVAARSLGSEEVINAKEMDDINNLETEKYRKKLMKGIDNDYGFKE